MSQHTPGPWDVRTCGRDAPHLTEVYQLRVDSRRRVASCGNNGDIHVDEANARLIAQAPRMLALLTEIMDDMNTIVDHLGSVEQYGEGRASIPRNTAFGVQRKARAILRDVEGE